MLAMLTTFDVDPALSATLLVSIKTGPMPVVPTPRRLSSKL